MGRLRYAALLIVPLGLLATATVAAVRSSGEQEYEVTATVLEAPERGPSLCLGGIETSYPPHCGSVRIAGWDWDDVAGEESASGTTWARVHVQGTFDGRRFTLTAPPGPPQPYEEREQDFRPACDDPSVVDANDGGEEWSGGLKRHDIPGFAALWVTDDSGPKWDGPFTANVVVRPGFAGDAEPFIRKYWGGYLCVVERDQPLAKDLREVQRRLPDVLSRDMLLVWGANERRGVVEARLIVVDEQARREVEEAFGKGIVELTGALRPISGA